MILQTYIFNSNFFWALLLYPLWAMVQQYLFQGFFSNRAKMCLGNREAAAVLAGLVFGFLHWPNAPLAIGAALWGFVWTRVYLLYPNLPVLALCHGILATAFYYLVLGVDILKEKL